MCFGSHAQETAPTGAICPRCYPPLPSSMRAKSRTTTCTTCLSVWLTRTHLSERSMIGMQRNLAQLLYSACSFAGIVNRVYSTAGKNLACNHGDNYRQESTESAELHASVYTLSFPLVLIILDQTVFINKLPIRSVVRNFWRKESASTLRKKVI